MKLKISYKHNAVDDVRRPSDGSAMESSRSNCVPKHIQHQHKAEQCKMIKLLSSKRCKEKSFYKFVRLHLLEIASLTILLMISIACNIILLNPDSDLL